MAVAFSGVTAVLSGVLAPRRPRPSRPRRAPPRASWPGVDGGGFVDPRTPAERRAQIAVPRKPSSYRGKARETRAVYRTHAGALAVPMRYAFGHQAQQGRRR